MKSWRSSAGGSSSEEKGGGVLGWRRLLRIHTKTCRKQNRDQLYRPEAPPEDLDSVEEVSRRLILREEQLFAQQTSEEEEEEEEQLLRDVQILADLLWTTIHNSFTCSSADQQEALRSAMMAIQQQEEQDRRWAGGPQGRAPPWRPLRFLRTHNQLLEKLVECRLTEACEDQDPGQEVSSALKRQVCQMGRRVKDDLLVAARTVAPCYPGDWDALTMYVRLYHTGFSRRLETLAGQEVQADEGLYLLLWARHLYTTEILQQIELHMKASPTQASSAGPSPAGPSSLGPSSLGPSSLGLSSAGPSSLGPSSLRLSSAGPSSAGLSSSCPQMEAWCLGPLLQDAQLKRLEEQFLSSTEDKLKLWLTNLLSREQQDWRTGSPPEVLDGYCFSPLAVHVIQVLDVALSEFSCVIGNQSEIRRLTVHLEDFLSRYLVCVQDLVKSSLSNVSSVIKAQLVCQQQLRDYISSSQCLSEEQKLHCLEKLSALRDCGYWNLTGPVQVRLKECLQSLWTPLWVDGSLPVIDNLLDFVNINLCDLSDLKPACRQVVLSLLHQDVVVHYVKKTLKMKSIQEQQVGGANRMIQDARMIDSFFTEEEVGGSWFCSILCNVAEILHLQDPKSIKAEILKLMHNCPDLSLVHLSALCSLKTVLSEADVCSLQQSLEELRLHHASTNHNPPFFSRVHIKGIPYKIRPMRR